MKLRVAKKILRREHRETKAKKSAFFPLFGLGPYSMHQIRAAKAKVDQHYGKPKITMDPLPKALPGSMRDIDQEKLVRDVRTLGKNIRQFWEVGRMLQGIPVAAGSALVEKA